MNVLPDQPPPGGAPFVPAIYPTPQFPLHMNAQQFQQTYQPVTVPPMWFPHPVEAQLPPNFMPPPQQQPHQLQHHPPPPHFAIPPPPSQQHPQQHQGTFYYATQPPPTQFVPPFDLNIPPNTNQLCEWQQPPPQHHPPPIVNITTSTIPPHTTPTLTPSHAYPFNPNPPPFVQPVHHGYQPNMQTRQQQPQRPPQRSQHRNRHYRKQNLQNSNNSYQNPPPRHDIHVRPPPQMITNAPPPPPTQTQSSSSSPPLKQIQLTVDKGDATLKKPFHFNINAPAWTPNAQNRPVTNANETAIYSTTPTSTQQSPSTTESHSQLVWVPTTNNQKSEDVKDTNIKPQETPVIETVKIDVSAQTDEVIPPDAEQSSSEVTESLTEESHVDQGDATSQTESPNPSKHKQVLESDKEEEASEVEVLEDGQQSDSSLPVPFSAPLPLSGLHDNDVENIVPQLFQSTSADQPAPDQPAPDQPTPNHPTPNQSTQTPPKRISPERVAAPQTTPLPSGNLTRAALGVSGSKARRQRKKMLEKTRKDEETRSISEAFKRGSNRTAEEEQPKQKTPTPQEESEPESEQQQSQQQPTPPPQRQQYQQHQRSTVYTGFCVWYNAEKCYGFISCPEFENELFVHRTALPPGTILFQGQEVMFHLRKTDEKPVAVRVRPCEPPPVDVDCQQPHLHQKARAGDVEIQDDLEDDERSISSSNCQQDYNDRPNIRRKWVAKKTVNKPAGAGVIRNTDNERVVRESAVDGDSKVDNVNRQNYVQRASYASMVRK